MIFLLSFIKFSPGQPIHILRRAYPWDSYSGVGGGKVSKKTLCQICVNLIDSSWHLVTQHATSVTVNIIKTIVNKWIHCLLISRSSVRSRDGPPFKTMGYSLGCSPFFMMFNRMFNKWGQNAVTPSPHL